MLIGTLSFEKNGDELTLRGAKRRELIAHVTAEHRPDLLVCAGHSLDNEDDLEQLANDGGILNGQSYLIVEVRKANDLVEAKKAGQLVEEHRVHLVGPGGRATSLGHQVVVKSEHLRGPEREKRIRLFEALIPEKSSVVKGHKLFALCCGEINVLTHEIRSGEKVRVCSSCVEDALLDATIVVNPTHDRMADRGHLSPKREWLSRARGGQNRVYVSASNWNSGRRPPQSPHSETLHTVFSSQGKMEMTRHPDLERGYMYRQCEVPL